MKICIPFLLLAIVATDITFARTVVLSESFDTAFPTSWSQQSQEGVQWELQLALGNYGTGCAVADQSQDSERKSGLLQTPFIDVTTVQNPTMSFRTALVQNNFVAPNISLWYDTGNGWQILRRWGSTFFEADVDIEQTQDFSPPLDAENIQWVEISYNLASVASSKHIRFAFSADFVNGGWVLLDKIVVSGDALTAVTEQGSIRDISVRLYPNPTTEKLFVDSHTEIESVEVVDVYGQSVGVVRASVATAAGVEVDMSALAKGTYFLYIKTKERGAQVVVRKVVVL